MSMERIRSARKMIEPFSTLTSTGSRPAYSALSWRPSSATRVLIRSSDRRISSTSACIVGTWTWLIGSWR
jgi:hypothetical protein